MYSIEYYKTKRKNTEWLVMDDPEENQLLKEEKTMHSACYKIKSLTIDVEDLFLFDETTSTISCLSVLASWAKSNPDVKQICIVNNNFYTEEIIYDIIRADWLVNKDNINISEEQLIDIIKQLNNLVNKIDDINDDDKKSKSKLQLKNKIKQLRYYFYELERIEHNDLEQSKGRVKRLGNNIMKLI